ncbi:nitrate reductase molybdenum cofactor assembly chaperone [Aeropyrum camini]|nr:nitrate reductase molybdenum cofactor assembly chaperone [Aeropyrum camini]
MGGSMRLTLKTLSIIFSYPGEDLEELARNREVVGTLLAGEDEEAASLIIKFLEKLNLGRADEEYVAVFEMPPKCSLYAHTYLLKGKEDMVGQLLLEVKSHYKAKQLDVPVEREIPTYLPAMLEYLALVYDDDAKAARRFAKKYIQPWVGELAACLERNGSLWSLPARALKRVVDEIVGGRGL